MNVEVGAAPLQAEKPPSIADPQILTPPAGSVAPKEHSPMLPEPQAPRSPLDVSAGKTDACELTRHSVSLQRQFLLFFESTLKHKVTLISASPNSLSTDRRL